MDEGIPDEKPPANEICDAKSVSIPQLDISNEDECTDANDEKVLGDKEDEGSDVEHQFEECIRDLCILRKTMPNKCSKLLEDYFEVETPNFEKYASKSTDDYNEFKYDNENFMKALADFKEQTKYCKEIQPVDFKDLEEHCKELIRLNDARRGMGLNNTQELLFSSKRKAEIAGEETNDNITNREVGPDHDMLPSFTTPDLHTKKDNVTSSTSMIPRLKKGKTTPVTPLTRRTSLRSKLLKTSVGKT